jgi:uncharacterized protein (DUF2062 family)
MTWSRIKKTAQQILHLGDSPRRTALAFAIGVFLAFSPLYGLHTISVFVFAWAFRLNAVAILAGSFINNPWTVIPILGSTMWIGLKLVPIGNPQTLDLVLQDLVILIQTATVRNHFNILILWQQFKPYLFPFIVGATALGIVCSLIAYPLVLFGLRRYHETQRRLSAALAASLRDESK